MWYIPIESHCRGGPNSILFVMYIQGFVSRWLIVCSSFRSLSRMVRALSARLEGYGQVKPSHVKRNNGYIWSVSVCAEKLCDLDDTKISYSLPFENCTYLQDWFYSNRPPPLRGANLETRQKFHLIVGFCTYIRANIKKLKKPHPAVWVSRLKY